MPGRMKFKTRSTSRYGKRLAPGKMSNPEIRYADILQAFKLRGEIEDWKFEAMTFKLANDLRFTPDFMILANDGTIDLIDVKGTGPIDDKAIAKIKMAAELFWWFGWHMDVEQPKKLGGGFVRRSF